MKWVYETVYDEATGQRSVKVTPWDKYAPKRPRSATSGEIVSVNAGVAPTQVQKGNRMMAEAGLSEVRFDAKGNLHAPDRRTYLKALHVRGLHNNDEICGGNSAPSPEQVGEGQP